MTLERELSYVKFLRTFKFYDLIFWLSPYALENVLKVGRHDVTTENH